MLKASLLLRSNSCLKKDRMVSYGCTNRADENFNIILVTITIMLL